MTDGSGLGQHWTVWEMPPAEPPRHQGSYQRLEAQRIARELNAAARDRSMSTHYVAWPTGSHPPRLGVGSTRL